MEAVAEEKLTKLIQDKTYEMLSNFSVLMKENNIPFFLACGTALGCARHHGFIPWDDDVDIYVLGRDYERLKKVLSEHNLKNIVLHDNTSPTNYPHYFPKLVATDTILKEEQIEHLDYVCGVYIDIFLLSEVSNNSFVRFFQEKKRYFYYCFTRAYSLNYNSKLICGLISLTKKVFPSSYVQRKLYKQYTRHVDNAKYLVDTGTFGQQALLKSEFFSKTIYMNFEKNKFPMPVMYEEYLSHYYGDWRSLPKEEDRKSNHNFSVLKFK